jgi:hypothetical protein
MNYERDFQVQWAKIKAHTFILSHFDKKVKRAYVLAAHEF